MSYQDRKILYKKIEDQNKRPLLVYVTSCRQGLIGVMADDALFEFVDQIEKLPKDTKEIDILLESNGGNPLFVWRLVSVIRSRIKKFNVIIPFSAYSAATLLALGADKIIMGKYGCLGPIDPQITTVNKDGSTQQFGYEDVISFFEFAKSEAGLTEQTHLEKVFSNLSNTVEPLAIGYAKRSSSLSVTLGERLLSMHMDNSDEKAKAKEIALKLNKNFFSHGHSLSREEAKEIGLKVAYPDDDLESTIWSIHKSFEEEFETRKPFNAISEFLSEPDAEKYLQSPPPLNIPASVVDPNYVAQLVHKYIMEQINQADGPKVIREVKMAFVESSSSASVCFQKMQILLLRTLDLQFMARILPLEFGWKHIEKENKSK